MNLKLDRFTWIVIGIVILLLAAAFLSVNLTGGLGAPAGLSYIEEDAPATPVQNAFVALEKGDIFRAREQYSQKVLDQWAKDSYDPLRSLPDNTNGPARRLRITNVTIDENDPEHALVSFKIDTYNQDNGPFGSGSTWTRTGTVDVVREDGMWKIDSVEWFY